jgi:predicted adenylyl cyclase CyaB
MARNVEIKARIGNVAAISRLVADTADGEADTFSQSDTYFQVGTGRLKLRESTDREAELIYYQRPDECSPTESNYHRIPIMEPQQLRTLLAHALGIRGEVSKRRQVYRIGRTRVHLDKVQDLGDFLELEVELEDEEPIDTGVVEARRLMQLLGIPNHALVAEAYIDLLGKES